MKWTEMENATKATLTNIAGQVEHALNNTATQFAAHSTTFGFMPGLMLGLRKG